MEYYSIEDWNSWIEELRGFDEIRMTLAAQVVEVPKYSAKEGLQFEKQLRLDIPYHAAKELKDSASFIHLLEIRPHSPKVSHGCYGLFNLNFYREGTLVGRLHYSHGEYWFPLTQRAQLGINAWLEAHGFAIAEVLKKDTTEANQALEPTTTSVTPPAGQEARQP